MKRIAEGLPESADFDLQAVLQGESNNSWKHEWLLFRLFARDAANYRLLTPWQEKTLGFHVRVLNDKKASEAMLLHNLRLVASIALRYRNRGLDLMDLIMEGVVGLETAVSKFDERKGNKFSTYATWWIREAIHRALADKGQTIRIPVHTRDRILKYRKVKWDLRQQLCREPSDEEIAREMKLSANIFRKLHILAKQAYTVGFSDLRFSFNDGDEINPEERIASRAWSPEQVAIASDELRGSCELLNQIGRWYSARHPRDWDIVVLCFGLDRNFEERIDKEVGDLYGLTKERIRQIGVKFTDALTRRNFGIASKEGKISGLIDRIKACEDIAGILADQYLDSQYLASAKKHLVSQQVM